MLLLQGNALRIPLADESVHCVVTSPPYWGLRKYSGDMAQIWGGDPECAHEWGDKIETKGTSRWDHFEKDGGTLMKSDYTDSKTVEQGQHCIHCGAWYGELGLEPTPELYVANMVAVFREVRRVMRHDASLWLNLGDSYAGSPAGNKGERRIGDGGQIFENKPFDSSKGTGLKPKDLCGIPWRIAFALQADGWWLRSDIIWSKPNPMPESVTDRPTKAHEYLFLLTKSARYYYDADNVREKVGVSTRRAASFRDGGIYTNNRSFDTSDKSKITHGDGDMSTGRNRRTVWHIATAPYSGAHFATYPPALVEPCIKAGTSERGVCPECGTPWERVTDVTYTKGSGTVGGHHSMARNAKDDGARTDDKYHGAPKLDKHVSTLGWKPTCECAYPAEVPPDSGLDYSLEPYQPIPATVFDPFAGSGTTLQVARALGRHGVGLDLSLEYLHLARTRLSLDALDAWGTAKKDGKSVLDLPLFEEL